MCLLFFYVNDNCGDDEYKVIIASNRDSYWDRPTKPAGFWENNKDCIGGIDLQEGCKGGTWLGACKNGRIGIILNVSGFPRPHRKGKGQLVTRYLTSKEPLDDYMDHDILPNAEEYNLFKLILLDIGIAKTDIRYFSNSDASHVQRPGQGVHVYGNSYPECPWEKEIIGKARFENIVQQYVTKPFKKKLVKKLINLLRDQTENALDDHLTAHGHRTKLEEQNTKNRSAIFVFSPSERCGTRTHTVLLVDKNNKCTYLEKTLKTPVDPKKLKWKTTVEKFQMDTSKYLKLDL